MERFEQIRSSQSDIFPFPEEGEVVYENPPCLIWIKDKANAEQVYTVTLRHEDGTTYELSSDGCFIRPDAPLPAGRYEWNVFSGERERGLMHFEIAENAITFIPPTGDEIFDAIDPAVHPRALFFREDIPAILADHAEDVEVLRENIRIALEVNDASSKESKLVADELLEHFELGARKNFLPGQLSGGQQQRVAIARALANKPSLLLADEPTAALDSHMGRKVMELLKNVAHSHNTAVLVVTHDHRAIDVFDRIFIMEDGKLREK